LSASIGYTQDKRMGEEEYGPAQEEGYRRLHPFAVSNKGGLASKKQPVIDRTGQAFENGRDNKGSSGV